MIVIIVLIVLAVAGVLVALLAVNRGKASFAEARAAAESASPGDLGRVLLEDHKLPAGQAIAIISDVTGCTPREAIDALRPHLNESLQKTYDDMSDERLETSKARLLR